MIEPISVWELEAGSPKTPGAEIPDDRRDKQGEDHRESGRPIPHGSRVLPASRFTMLKADGARREQHAEEIEESRPDHGGYGREGVGVDDRGDGVGCVVESVDEFETRASSRVSPKRAMFPVSRKEGLPDDA